MIDKTTTLKFRSKDIAGNIEPVKAAAFTIERPVTQLVFDNDPDRDGYVKADASGRGVQVGTFSSLAVGLGRDDRDCRAVLHFDTSALPDNASITHAYLKLDQHSTVGEPGSSGGRIQVDVKSGQFGASRTLQANDWGAKATVEAVAQVDEPRGGGTMRSSEFSEAGRGAIKKAGATQIRLRFERRPDAPGNYAFINGETAQLCVRYTIASTESARVPERETQA